MKVSKLGDTLYSTMKDLIVYVMEEMAKESEVDYKFQMPKHTSFVGAIIKTVGIDVIANNPTYRDYVHSLAVSQGRYPFDMNSASETCKASYAHYLVAPCSSTGHFVSLPFLAPVSNACPQPHMPMLMSLSTVICNRTPF